MNTATLIFLTSAFFFSSMRSNTLASENDGRVVGNGGSGIVCRKSRSVPPWSNPWNGHPESVELLDFYEGRLLRGLTLHLGSDQLSLLEKVDLVLSRLTRVSPKRSERYRNQARDFFWDALLLSNETLVSVPDTFHLTVPKDCTVEQIAIQREPRFPEDKRYLINKELWDAMNLEHQTGLVLHEIIYREAIGVGQKDSVNTRYFLSRLVSSETPFENEKDFTDFLTLIGFPSTDR